jgi:hypothetical protein
LKTPKQTKISDFKQRNGKKIIKLQNKLMLESCDLHMYLSSEPLSLAEKSGFSEIFDVACPR